MKNRTRKNLAIICACALKGCILVPSYQAEAAESHMDQVTEMDSTYEGFMANDDTLTFDEIKSLPGAIVAEEYDALIDLKVTPVSELFHMGMSPADVERIKTKSVKDLVLENVATYPDEFLESKGLSADTVQAIKTGNYDVVSESEARRVGAQLALGIASISRVGNQLNYTVYWHWDNSRPLNLIEDVILTTISNDYCIQGGSTGKAYYAPINSMEEDMEERIYPSSEVGTNGIRYDIAMQYPAPVGNRWTKSGKAFVPTQYGYAGVVDIFAEYFHKWTDVTVEVIDGHLKFPVNSGDTTRTHTSVS